MNTGLSYDGFVCRVCGLDLDDQTDWICPRCNAEAVYYDALAHYSRSYERYIEREAPLVFFGGEDN